MWKYWTLQLNLCATCEDVEEPKCPFQLFYTFQRGRTSKNTLLNHCTVDVMLLMVSIKCIYLIM